MPHVKITLGSIQCLSTTDSLLFGGTNDELYCFIENRQVYLKSGQDGNTLFGASYKQLGPTCSVGEFGVMPEAIEIDKVLFDGDVDPAAVPYGLYLLFFDADSNISVGIDDGGLEVSIGDAPVDTGPGDDIGIIGFRVVPFEGSPVGYFFPQEASGTKSTPFPAGNNVNGVDFQIEGNGGLYSLWLKGEIS